MIGNKGGRKLNEYTVGETKHYNMIPSSHLCIDCNRGPLQVNFYVRPSNNEYGWFIAKRCNQCVSLHARGAKTIKDYNRINARHERRILFIKKFKEYTWK